MSNYRDMLPKRNPHGLMSYVATGWIGHPGQTGTKGTARIGTFLCPHCDKTHVVVQYTTEEEFEGTDPKDILEINFKMDAASSSDMANEFLNPNPIDPSQVVDARTRK